MNSFNDYYAPYNPKHTDSDLRNVTYDEFNAIRFENVVRDGAGVPLRTAYCIDTNNKIFMPISLPGN